MLNFNYKETENLAHKVYHMYRKEGWLDKSSKAIEYITDKLIKNNHSIDSINQFDRNMNTWGGESSYKWIAYQGKDYKLLVRCYRQHFTLYFLNEQKMAFFNNLSFADISIDIKKTGDDHDAYVENSEKFVMPILKQIIETYEEGEVNGLKNNIWTIPTRTSPFSVSLIYQGETISKLDMFEFCFQELSNIYKSVFINLDLKELCLRHIGKEFKIPRYSGGGHFLSIHEINNRIVFKYVDREGKEGYADLYNIYNWNFDKVIPFLQYLG